MESASGVNVNGGLVNPQSEGATTGLQRVVRIFRRGRPGIPGFVGIWFVWNEPRSSLQQANGHVLRGRLCDPWLYFPEHICLDVGKNVRKSL